MPPKFAVGLKACGVAVALLLATAHAAENTASLIGATREQVLVRHGEPKSQITAGNREILFFARQRIVLREGVVVEVEQLAAEPAPRRTPPSDLSEARDSPAARPGSSGTAASAAAGTGAPPPSEAPGQTALPVTSPELKVEIKSVRPPGSPAPSSDPKPETPDMTPATAPAGSTETAPAHSATKAASVRSAEVNTPGRSTPPTPARTPATTPPPAIASGPRAVPPDIAQPTRSNEEAESERAAEAAQKSRLASPPPSLVEGPDVPDAADVLFTRRNSVILLLVAGCGFGYFCWRYRQRQLELAATSVSHLPLDPPAASRSGAAFTADLLSKLEWKRFEELVASYYSKTGVVASRTRSGPANPVNIRISWKGESRPFACVKCIAHPVGLIDVKPLQELVSVLVAEDIRRSYVVTTGKFSVNARDFAEEKQITLLTGDIFLEKLNALPDSARSELMQEITRGDFTTPSCPMCDARMVRPADNPSMWRCSTHAEQRLPVR